MASVPNDAELGLQQGMLWLPSHVPDQACDSKNRQQKQQQKGYHRLQQEPPHSQGLNFAAKPPHQRPKNVTGGPGMQAVFIVSRPGSCGTGVFLPQKGGTKSTKKLACAPVLLPERVVRALNLKVDQLGLHISPPQGQKYSPSGKVFTTESTDKKKSQKQCCSISQSQNSSTEIFLPKEWTY